MGKIMKWIGAWKKEVVPEMCLKVLIKTTKSLLTITCALAQFQTMYLPKTSQTLRKFEIKKSDTLLL